MNYIFLLSFLLCSTCAADQPFEPLSVTAGVPPLHIHPVHPDVLILQSAEQFIRFVSSAPGSCLVLLDSSTRGAHAQALKAAVSVTDSWQPAMKMHVVHADTHMPLVRALARTAGLQTITLPILILFTDGKAVLPGIDASLSIEQLRVQLAKHLAYVQHAGSGMRDTLGEWWDAGVAYLQGIWAKITRFLL